jgi:hypothetical protein
MEKFLISCPHPNCPFQNMVEVGEHESVLQLAISIHRYFASAWCTCSKPLLVRKIDDLTPEEWQKIYDYEKSCMFENANYWFQDYHISWPEYINK